MTRLAVAVALALCGCDDPLKSVQRIEELRVLGARAEVQGQPERAWAAPGETLNLTFFAVAPEPQQALGWVFEACQSAAYETALSPCEGEPFARVEARAVEAGPPRLSLTLPDDIAPGAELSVRGIVCADSQARAEHPWPAFSCARANAQRVTTVLRLTVAGTRDNHNPSLAGEVFELDAAPWSAPPALPEDELCSDGSPLPRMAADGTDHRLQLRLRGDGREELPSASGPAPRRETLELSHFATAGELARPYTFFEWDDASPERLVELSWTAPLEARLELTGPQPVRFYFVLRDGRGGSDWTHRALCLTPQ